MSNTRICDIVPAGTLLEVENLYTRQSQRTTREIRQDFAKKLSNPIDNNKVHRGFSSIPLGSTEKYIREYYYRIIYLLKDVDPNRVLVGDNHINLFKLAEFVPSLHMSKILDTVQHEKEHGDEMLRLGYRPIFSWEIFCNGSVITGYRAGVSAIPNPNCMVEDFIPHAISIAKAPTILSPGDIQNLDYLENFK